MLARSQSYWTVRLAGGNVEFVRLSEGSATSPYAQVNNQSATVSQKRTCHSQFWRELERRHSPLVLRGRCEEDPMTPAHKRLRYGTGHWFRTLHLLSLTVRLVAVLEGALALSPQDVKIARIKEQWCHASPAGLMQTFKRVTENCLLTSPCWHLAVAYKVTHTTRVVPSPHTGPWEWEPKLTKRLGKERSEQFHLWQP